MADGRKCLPCPRCSRPVRALAAPFGMRTKGMTYLADCPGLNCGAQDAFYASVKLANNGNMPYFYSAGAARKCWNEWAEASALGGEVMDEELMAAIALLSEVPTTSETPGVHGDDDFDALIMLARKIRGRK